MNQPVPQVSAADVERIVEREFPGSADHALSLLQQYGKAEWHREIDRVRLACVKLAKGDLQKLTQAINTATSDYRDVLAWAEYPAYMRTDPNPSREAAEKERAIKADWKQYENWRAGPEKIRGGEKE